jgi:hypothetical protein
MFLSSLLQQLEADHDYAIRGKTPLLMVAAFIRVQALRSSVAPCKLVLRGDPQGDRPMRRVAGFDRQIGRRSRCNCAKIRRCLINPRSSIRSGNYKL